MLFHEQLRCWRPQQGSQASLGVRTGQHRCGFALGAQGIRVRLRGCGGRSETAGLVPGTVPS